MAIINLDNIFDGLYDITSFFKAKYREMKRESSILCLPGREKKIKNGDYTIVNCFFDTEKNELVDNEQDLHKK